MTDLMQTVTLTDRVLHNGLVRQAGEQIEVSVADAMRLVNEGIAVVVPATTHDSDIAVGSISWVKIKIAHDTPALTTGVEIYVPEVNELLLDAWIDATVDWNGTTPFADIGKLGGVGGGLFVYANADPVPLGSDAPATYVTGFALQQVCAGLAQMSAAGAAFDLCQVPAVASTPAAQKRLIRMTASFGSPAVPARITDTSPIVVWVSQDGTYDGVASGSTVGEAFICSVSPTLARAKE